MWKVDNVLQLFAPFDCLGCQKEGPLVCKECRAHSLPSSPKRCYKCHKPCPSALCISCRSRTRLTGVYAATAYKGISSQLIGRLKFARTQSAAAVIASVMSARLRCDPDLLVTHIPTANQRVRSRGYDQAQLIAREFARNLHLPYQPLLYRQGKTRQVGSNRKERLLQLQSAYYCRQPELARGKNVLLIDDVLTTGATIETAAKVLKEAGATEVRAVLFAQKI